MNWYKFAIKKERDFSSTQVQLPESVSAKVKAFSKKIPDSSLAEDGKETDIHITTCFGLYTEDADIVKKIVSGFGKVEAVLGKTSIFAAKEGKDYDVIKVDVESDDLMKLNKLIFSNTECKKDYEYNPHITIAYVKKGEGKKYSGDDFLEGTKVEFDFLMFSDKSGNKTEISL